MADDDLAERVKAAYRRHFGKSKDSSAAWNLTLDEVSGPYNPDASDEWQELRSKVVNILRGESRKLDAELGDPFAMAVEAALRDLREDRAAEEVRAEWRRVDEERRKTIRKEKKLDIPKGPKEWTPRKEKREEEVERLIERQRENDPDDMTLYITFDDKGALREWKIDYPSYWSGHGGGPTAYVLASGSLDYGEIRSAIEEALGELDWDEIERELEEEGDDAS